MTNLSPFKTLYVEKDGFLAWVICFCALINNAIVNGIDCSFGVILSSVMKKLNSSASTVSWIASIHTSCMFLFAWISTILTQKFGFRLVITFGVIISCVAYICSIFTHNFIVLLLSYGVVGGAGSGLLFSPGNIVTNLYFEKLRPIATGIAMCGAGIGVAAISPLTNYLNIEYGPKAVYMSFALLSLLSLLLGIVSFPVQTNDDISRAGNEKIAKTNTDVGTENGYREAFRQMMMNLRTVSDQVVIGSPEDTNPKKRLGNRLTNPRFSIIDFELPMAKEPEKPRGFKDKFKMLKDPRMLFYCLSHVMFELAFYIPVVYLPEMMVDDHGFDKSVEGTIIAVLGAAGVFGKLSSGVMAKLFKKHVILISAVNLVCLGAGSIGLVFCSSYAEYIGVTFWYGVFQGSFDNYCVFSLIEIYGATDKFQDAYGLVMLAKMASPIWGPPIGGSLHDLFGEYYPAFYAAASFQFTSSIFNFIVLLFHIKHR